MGWYPVSNGHFRFSRCLHNWVSIGHPAFPDKREHRRCSLCNETQMWVEDGPVAKDLEYIGDGYASVVI